MDETLARSNMDWLLCQSPAFQQGDISFLDHEGEMSKGAITCSKQADLAPPPSACSLTHLAGACSEHQP